MTLISGRYEIGDKIGDGGMGEVFMGKDTRTGRIIAIKQLKSEMVVKTPELIERFRREGEALRRLNHPNIVRIYDLTTDSDCYYIIMEYVRGGTLQELLEREGPLPVQKGVSIALELSDALARAHHLNIIHRDIKSANVLMAEDHTPRLTDFGLAHIGDRTRVTRVNTVMGTLAYLSPEALDGKPGGVLSDIWAFGVLIYEMVTGTLPFREDSNGATMRAILQKPMPEITRDDIPPRLRNLIAHMLQKDPDIRIANARLVGAELHAILHSEPSRLDTDQLALPNAENSILHALLAELVSLTETWQAHAHEADQITKQPHLDSLQSYFHRGRAQAFRDAAKELYSLLEQSEERFAGQPTATYAAVSRKQVEGLLDIARIKYTDLYEDEGHIFTVVFPGLLALSLDDRLAKLKELAPGLVVLETGKLNSGEPYADIAFDVIPK